MTTTFREDLLSHTALSFWGLADEIECTVNTLRDPEPPGIIFCDVPKGDISRSFLVWALRQLAGLEEPDPHVWAADAAGAVEEWAEREGQP